MGERGTYNWEGMNFLEKTFTKNDAPENNWIFDYFIVKDALKNTVLSTFLTTAIWKDDMLSSEAVSIKIEAERKKGSLLFNFQGIICWFFINRRQPSVH